MVCLNKKTPPERRGMNSKHNARTLEVQVNVTNNIIGNSDHLVKTDVNTQKIIMDKDCRIAALEFEVEVQKSMLEALQRSTLQFISIF